MDKPWARTYLSQDHSEHRQSMKENEGPRAILRVPEVLMAVATADGGRTLADLCRDLGVPKTSLHRLLRVLEHAGYLVNASGTFLPGPESARLAAALQGGPPQPHPSFPACARPVLEWFAGITGETTMIGAFAEQSREIVYLDVVESTAPLRYAPAIGDRRPLHAVPAGKAILAFQPLAYRLDYLDQAEFVQATPQTTDKAELPDVLEQVRHEAVAFDRNGYVRGASALASPIFGRDGRVRHAVSVTGPTDRIAASLDSLRDLTRTAGQRISRILGFSDPYPPA